MNVDAYRIDWLTRRRYLAYVLVTSLVGGGIVGYLLGGEHTAAALAAAGVVAIAIVVPKLLARRTLFDERDRRMDERAAWYTMVIVLALALPSLVAPIVLEQLGVVPLQGWLLGIGIVLMGIVYLYLAIVLALNYRA
ncbi:hypothetical protein L593_02680 [Salinarchaeum sp. Harcht-Bsk1]|uniref:DUF2178 domain-containing protein n=1 Tax=Salinarchaeum sp. Harcht-Bsk1 TaxID=1333523 RepID=UPI0003424074|nr:DUF2178 domain-containing protein [Salinarchaeum sp. Harcht-Bsk1]AGN00487.1 hypothetical protein L593_02680 [Salinarchaeum sp. Harcht-Bsk1]